MACEQQSFNQQKVRSQQVQGSEDSPRSSLLTGGEKERGQDTLPYTEPAESVRVL